MARQMCEEAAADTGYMFVEQCSCMIYIACTAGIDDCTMFVISAILTFGQAHLHAQIAFQFVVDRADEADQKRSLGWFVEAGVQLPVKFGPVTHIDFANELLTNAFGVSEGLFGHIGDGQAQHFVFKQDAHFEHLRQFRLGDACYHSSLVTLEHDQAFGLQTLERFTYGNLADVEQARHVVLPDWLALSDIARNDCVTQVFGYDLRGSWCKAEVGGVEASKRQGGLL